VEVSSPKRCASSFQTKTNKQIREKRAEATYRSQLNDRLQSHKNKNETTEGEIEAPKIAAAQAVNGLKGQRITRENPIAMTSIIAEDHSETSSKKGLEWKEAIIRNTLETEFPETEISAEGTGIITFSVPRFKWQ